MRSLVEDHQAVGAAYQATVGPELWRAKLADALVRRFEAAAPAGEIRRDLPADTLARWIVRINFSLIAAPALSKTAARRACCTTCSFPRYILSKSLDDRPSRPRRATVQL